MKRLSALCLLVCVILLISCGENKERQQDYANSAAKIDSANKRKFIHALATDSGPLNYIDANGKEQAHWIYLNKVRHLPGYDSNAKVEEGNYKDGMKEGVWVEYNADGSIKSQVTYKDGKRVD